MQLWPRVLLASVMGIATSCSLVYDVDSITSANGDCGAENAPCCGSKCNAALTCVDNTCQRCSAKDGGKCCLAPDIAACSSDAGALNLNGTCNGGKCVLPCSASSPACSAIPKAICCKDATGCDPCDAPCVCKVCCAKCGATFQAVAVSAGQSCVDQGAALCGASAENTYWSTTGC